MIGKTLATFFAGVLGVWIFALIIIPQSLLLEKSFSVPERHLESHKINNFLLDLQTCKLLLSLDQADAIQCQRVGVSSAEQLTKVQKHKEQELAKAISNQRFLYGIQNYKDLFSSNYAIYVLLKTIAYSVFVTVLCLIISYPIAYNVAVVFQGNVKLWAFVLLVTPYFSAELIRIYSWLAVIDMNGILNTFNQYLNLPLVNYSKSSLTVFFVLIYTYILFMIFPLYNGLCSLDKNLIRAAQTLGAGTITTHKRIIIPNIKLSIVLGCITVFMLTATSLSVPRIISRGLQGDWFSQAIYRKFFESPNGEVGSAYSVALTALCFFIVYVFLRINKTTLRKMLNE